MFCKACLIEFSTSSGQWACPSCSKPLTVDLSSKSDAGNNYSKSTIKGFKSTSILNRIQLNEFQTSTKIEALVCGASPLACISSCISFAGSLFTMNYDCS